MAINLRAGAIFEAPRKDAAPDLFFIRSVSANGETVIFSDTKSGPWTGWNTSWVVLKFLLDNGYRQRRRS